jgi:hypothetical protein
MYFNRFATKEAIFVQVIFCQLKNNQIIAMLKAPPVFSVIAATYEALDVEFGAELPNIYMLCIQNDSLVNNQEHDGDVKLGGNI